jgi:hypothetical protein
LRRRLRPGVGSTGVPGVSGRCCGAFRGVGELHRPGALLAGVDLEEAGAVEAARQAILVPLMVNSLSRVHM